MKEVLNMATRYFADPVINCLIVRHTGTLMINDIVIQLGDVFANEEFKGNMNILRDMRDAQLSD